MMETSSLYRKANVMLYLGFVVVSITMAISLKLDDLKKPKISDDKQAYSYYYDKISEECGNISRLSEAEYNTVDCAKLMADLPKPYVIPSPYTSLRSKVIMFLFSTLVLMMVLQMWRLEAYKKMNNPNYTPFNFS